MADFELFEPGKACERRLPVNEVHDEFVIQRFVTLKMAADNRHDPPVSVVLPRDVVNPHLVSGLRDELEHFGHDVDLPAIRGGKPLSRSWRKPNVPSRSQPRTIRITDRNEFLSNPAIEMGGRTVVPRLTSTNVSELLETGITVVHLGQAQDEEEVRVEVTATLPRHDNPERESFVDVGSLISRASQTRSS